MQYLLHDHLPHNALLFLCKVIAALHNPQSRNGAWEFYRTTTSFYHAHFIHLTQNGHKQLIFNAFNSVGYTYKHLTHHLAHLSILHMSYYVVPGTMCGNGGGIFGQREVEFSVYPTKNRLSLYRQTQVYVPSYSAGNRVYPTCMQCVTLLAECKILHDVSYTT